VKWFACIHPRGVALVFELWLRGSRSLLELCYCLSCVELLPFLNGTETCLLQVLLLFAFSFGCVLTGVVSDEEQV
jgi:hypothetical protein